MNFIKIPVLSVAISLEKYGENLGAVAELAFHKFVSVVSISALRTRCQLFHADSRQILATPLVSSVPRVTSV